jgi:hypothetical protein
MVKAVHAGGTNIHARSFSDGFKALKNVNIFGGIIAGTVKISICGFWLFF